MEKTPFSMRTHVSIFGNTNAGKSALFNKLLNQDMSIVSEKSGTTTDPVTKAMELIPFGPVALTDTAGLGDKTQIGEKREEKTRKILDRTDFAVYAADVSDFDEAAYEEFKSETEKRNIEHMLVFTKSDLMSGKYLDRYPNAAEVSVYDEDSIEKLRNLLSQRLSQSDESKDTMIGGLLEKGSTVVLVIPIDSEAPKGRIILPQVQLLRDCLDHGMKAVCVRDSELKQTLDELKRVDLVVTDSQAFKTVSEIVPQNIMLTSFSMMTASLKGDLGIFVRGAEKIESLHDGSRILMAEACTHNISHEDIGRKKIPFLLRKYTGKDLQFDYCVYQDFPDKLNEYDLVIHCGGCMINARTMKNRVLYCERAGVAITNYGVVLAYVNGILDRSIKIFKL
jgi:[FeFe] hydrogenase H-cluster maturation GTPase HydF